MPAIRVDAEDLKKWDLIGEGLYIQRIGHHIWLKYGDHVFCIDDAPKTRSWKKTDTPSDASEADGELRAPMPGRVLKICVENKTEVKAGELVLVLEAMKMEFSLQSPHDGFVEDLCLQTGDTVQLGQMLCLIRGKK